MRKGMVLVGLVLAVLLASCSSETLEVSDVADYEARSINASDPSAIVATVNGEELTVADVRSSAIRYGVSPTDETFDQLLEGLIIARVVTQGAEPVNESDLDARIDDIAGNLTRDELEAVLAQQGLSIGLVRERIREELVMSERFSGEVIGPSDVEIRDYYARNAARFVTPERLVVRHFFVANDSRSIAERQSILQGYVNATERCAYIAQYSDDAGTANEETCGLLVISRGSAIPELEYGAYGTPPGASRVVQSRFGAHVITVEGIVPAQALNLSEATPYVEDILTAQERERVAAREVSSMLEDADITVYYAR